MSAAAPPDDQPAASGRCWSTTRAGPPGACWVVLVHGSLDRSTSFARVDRALPEATVTRYDRRGYGRSVDLGAPTSFDQQVEDLLAVLDACAERVGGNVDVGRGRPVLVAHSYGGVVALAAAQRHPDRIAAVVAYEAPTPWVPWWPARSAGGTAVAGARDPGGAAEAFMRRMIGDDRWERLPPSTRDQRRAEGPALVAEMAHLRTAAEPLVDASRIKVPVVIGSGERSAAHHQRGSRALAAAAPRGEHHEVAGAGHGVHLTHPGALADLARRGLELAQRSG